jgi:3-phosphoglycerate kinase
MKYIDEVQLSNKTVLLRVDFNVSLNPAHHITNDERIRQTLPTILYLLKQHNSVILISHLGNPKGVDATLSLKEVSQRLQELLPSAKVIFVKDFKSLSREKTRTGNLNELYLLENIRFHSGEKANDLAFAKELALLGDVYVNDAFSVSHRTAATTVSLPSLLPAFGGLLLKKEVEALTQILKHPKHPFVALLGGAKISTKMQLLEKIITVSDEVLLGGGIANTFLLALGNEVGKSLVETNEKKLVLHLLKLAKEHNTSVLLPVDAIVGDKKGSYTKEKSIQDITASDQILDIGTQTQAMFGSSIAHAKTILWNGPFGMIEVDAYKRGTDFLYYTIAENKDATSVVGGGETLAALTNKDHLERISHISTGGGAMLAYIEKGTLPGIEALQ